MPSNSEARRLHERYRQGELSPVAVATAQLDAVTRLDREVNAFCLVDADVTLAMAQKSEERYRRDEPLSPLDGVPVSLKDTINVAGWPTRRGSRTTSDTPVPIDAISVARLRAAGAVFLGKTTTPEFAWKGLTDSPIGGVTRNPRDPGRSAGGSSGGAAAAASLGLGVIAVGSDAAGSVRIPAAFCGVVGYKPSFAAVPLDPYPPAFSQLAHIGLITRTVADAALAASIMIGADPSDWTSLARNVLVTSASDTLGGFDGIRIGILRDAAGICVDPEVERAWQEFLATLRGKVAFTEIAAPLSEARDIAGILYRIGCANALSRVPEERRHEVDPGLLAFVEPVRDLRADELLRVLQRREEIASEAAALLSRQVDVVLTPTMPCLPPYAEPAPGSGAASDWLDWNPFTPFFNVTHGPAVSVPWWGGHEGSLPIGIQVGAAPGRDAAALRVAAAVEHIGEGAVFAKRIDSSLEV